MKDNPPPMEFISGSGKSFNTIHANNFEFYEELHTVIEREPVEMLDPELRGLFASIGSRRASLCPGRADEADHDRSGGGGQRDGTRPPLG
jgi:hypothetical protein